MRRERGERGERGESGSSIKKLVHRVSVFKDTPRPIVSCRYAVYMSSTPSSLPLTHERRQPAEQSKKTEEEKRTITQRSSVPYSEMHFHRLQSAIKGRGGRGDKEIDKKSP